MPKINKDFSDALGFRLLSSYQSFVNEYPVEGAQIQKLYDDGFRETCIKCYPVIVGTGVDPTLYEPKFKPGNDLKNELRNMFPIKTKSPTSETIDLTDEETVAYKPVVALPVVKKPSPKREPVSPPKKELVSLPRPSPIRPQQKCANCEKLRQQVLDLEIANNKVMKLNKEQTEVIVQMKEHNKKLQSYLHENNEIIGKHQQTIADLQSAKNMNLRTISALEKENYKMVGLVKQCQATVKDLDLQIEASKKRKQ